MPKPCVNGSGREIDRGKREGLTSPEQAHVRELGRENRELKRADEILRKPVLSLAKGQRCFSLKMSSTTRGAQAPTEIMVSFIDEHRDNHGVEPICQQLPIAPSTYYEHKARVADSERLPKRIKRDLQLEIEIRRVYEANFRLYGARKVWRQLNREEIEVARCTAGRLIPKGHK